MGKKETNISNQFKIDVSKIYPELRLFRNNVGQAWQGVRLKTSNPNVLHLAYPRVIKYGLMVGSSDDIGYLPITITPDMIGKRVAIFTSIEYKTPKKQPTPEQINWIARTRLSGGIAGRCDSTESGTGIINSYIEALKS